MTYDTLLRVLSILLPTAFFASLDRGVVEPSENGLVNDSLRGNFLQMSRGIAIILLVM
jgi:Ca2+:H+ antiporter